MHGILKVRSERSTVCTILTVRIHDGHKTNSAQKHFSCTIVNTHITEQVWLFWVQQIWIAVILFDTTDKYRRKSRRARTGSFVCGRSCASTLTSQLCLVPLFIPKVLGALKTLRFFLQRLQRILGRPSTVVSYSLPAQFGVKLHTWSAPF